MVENPINTDKTLNYIEYPKIIKWFEGEYYGNSLREINSFIGWKFFNQLNEVVDFKPGVNSGKYLFNDQFYFPIIRDISKLRSKGWEPLRMDKDVTYILYDFENIKFLPLLREILITHILNK